MDSVASLKSKMFLTQEYVFSLESKEIVKLDGDMLYGPEGGRFRLMPAVYVAGMLTEGKDPADWLGTVKDVDQILALGGELLGDSVVLGEQAYQVIEGFLAIADGDVEKQRAWIHALKTMAKP